MGQETFNLESAWVSLQDVPLEEVTGSPPQCWVCGQGRPCGTSGSGWEGQPGSLLCCPGPGL